MKKNIKTLINIIAIIAVLFSTYNISKTIKGYRKADLSTKKVVSIKESKTDSLYDTNNDFRFWINVNNINIDYPVVQGEDNSFYLTHDFFKEESVSGSVFLDFRTNNKSKNSTSQARIPLPQRAPARRWGMNCYFFMNFY